MANLIYRSTSADPGRGASSVKNLPLTNAEVDGNFKVVDVALGLLAPLASPTFTGTPTLPTGTIATTQTVGNATTAVATTAFVNAEIANDAPTKTGSGASGTWSIDIDGSAYALKSATTEVVVNAAVAPSIGQVLTATSSTAASWQTASAGDMVLASVQSVTGAKTFNNSTLKLLASVNGGVTTFSNANASATSYTITFPATNGTVLTTGATVAVTQGGTGVTTLPLNSVLIGANTGNVTSVAPSTSGNVLTSNGTSWVSSTPAASGATITNDNATSTTQYLGMSRVVSGAWTAAYVASSKLYFDPATGTLNSTIYNSLSDANAKKNVITISGATNIVNKLRGVEFEWLDNDTKSSGVIAQEIETVLPYLVSTSDAGDKSVNYSGIIGFLIESIKELNARIDALENK